jgi:hypothetical protein
VSKPLATNSASKKKVHNRFRRGSIFKKIRNKLKFVGANKAVLETGKVSAESTVPFCSQFLLVNEFQNKAKNPAPKKYNFIELQQRSKIPPIIPN